MRSSSPVPDGLFFDFGLSVQMPDTPGETLYFPVVQTCESGETRWIEIPADGEDGHALESPAPAVAVAVGGVRPGRGGRPGGGGRWGVNRRRAWGSDVLVMPRRVNVIASSACNVAVHPPSWIAW